MAILASLTSSPGLDPRLRAGIFLRAARQKRWTCTPEDKSSPEVQVQKLSAMGRCVSSPSGKVFTIRTKFCLHNRKGTSYSYAPTGSNRVRKAKKNVCVTGEREQRQMPARDFQSAHPLKLKRCNSRGTSDAENISN
jgi:hypothetical protein